MGPEEQLPAEVPAEELSRRAQMMFSGTTGAVVASGSVAATTAPSYQLVSDVSDVIEALEKDRPQLFDRFAEQRPCGLLCQRGAAGMLLADVLGLPLVPWVLAEPIGKAALKLKGAIPGEKKKAKKKAKRRGADAEAAAAALLRRAVALPLPTADEVKAAWRRIAREARSRASPPAPAPALELSAPPAPEPEPEAEPAPRAICARAHDRFDMAQTPDAIVAIGTAFYIARCMGEGCDSYYEEDLDMAQLKYKHALRRLARSYPGEFDGLSQSSWWQLIQWTTRMRALGLPIPAAERAAAKMEMCVERPAACWLSRYGTCGKCEDRGDTGPGGCMCAYTRPGM